MDPPQPTATRLRPLHTRSYNLSAVYQETGELAHWTSTLKPNLDDSFIVQAFLKVASQLLVINPGESYYVHDSNRGGYIRVLPSETNRRHSDSHLAFEFMPYTGSETISTDISVGHGRALQLHLPAPGGALNLVSYANIVPQPALDSIGTMLDDIVRGLQSGLPHTTEWTRPSVLNCPPALSPPPIFPNYSIPKETRDHEAIGSFDNHNPLLHAWFEQRAAETPQAIALEFLIDLDSGKRVQYTYKQLETASSALAAELLRTCTELQTLPSPAAVAVLIGPCPEMYISYIAILKAGLAFCPIAHDTPKERLQALFEDLQPITVLVAGSAPSAASAMSAKPLLDTTPYLRACDVSTSCSLEKGTPTIPSTSTAYVLYTSGTTGRAKGVAISHASAACTISALSSHYGFGQLLGPTNTQQLRWFQGAAPTFDISIFEIFWTLSTGSTLCCAPRDFTLQNLDKVLTTLKADITNITPSFASLLDPSSIKGLMLGGESLTTRIIQDFAPYNAAAISRSVGKPSGLYNGYGPTEAAIYCIAQAHVPSGQRGSVIGTPLSTCGVLIVDEGYTEAASTLTLRPVPMGATGELVLIGPQISQTGYINRESETAAAFFDDDTWGRGYKSGDRARIVWDDRGNPIIEFLGRISDDQVKLSGRRVELAEIESILTEKVPQIRETLSVVWRPQGSVSGSEKVVSLIVLDPDSRDDFGSVERDCMRVAHQYLPDYMRPFRLLNVEELPKSSSGKKNRAKAAEYVQVHLEQHNYPTSRDVDIGRRSPLSNESDAKLEDELLEMVSNILGTNQTINATTLLASTGLDSLLAMRFLRDIRHRWSRSDLGQEDPRYSQLQPSLAQLLGADASIRSVFFSAFAEGKREQARLRVAEFSRKNMPEALSKLNVTPRDVEAILPATNTQSQLAVSFAMDARNYISHSILRLRAGTCVPALMHSIESVISLQPIYRSMMIPCDDSFSPFAQVVVTQDAWSQITEASPRITHQKVCAQYLDSGIDDLVENAAAKMNLESNILYQIQVIEEDQDIASPVVLILSFAHCICDGASIQLLLLDIASCFSGQTLPQRNSIFDSVVDWASGLDPATDRMWQDELVGQEAESLGSLSGNNAEFGQSKEKKDFGMVQHQSELSWAYLESRSRILNSSPLSIVQAAWCVLISLLSEADTLDVTFGSVLSGHHTPTHAPDFSVVPCRVALPSSQTVQELLEALNAKSRVAQTKRHTSFGVLRALPYNTALALQAYTDSDEKREPEVASFPWTEARSRAIRYDFAIFAEVIPPSGGLPGSPEYFGDGMTFKITYHEDTLSKVSAGFVARQLAGLVDVFLGADPYDLVQALPSRLPRHLLSVEGNATDQSHSAESHATLLHSQFESQAAATPDRVALTFYTSLDTPPTDVSYRELDSRANGLANILRQENAEVIPICIQRSVDLYVAILAILKAGSAWCPIDDTSPIQRRTSLIARTQSNVLLTNKESLHLVEPCLSQESLHGWRVIIMDEYANHELLVRPNPRTGTLSPGSICGTDLAYLLWTSGTTGEPKGVMIPHSAAFQAMKDLQIQVAHDDKAGQVRTLQLSSYTFDVFVQDLFYTWGLAGCVVSGTRELILGTFVDFIWKARPTHAHLTPSFGASIAVEEIRGSTLHYVTFIGEKLTEDVAHAWAAPDITTAAYNTYGPAENAVVSTMRQFRGKTREPAKAANVGFPLNSCTAFVVREVEMAHGQQKRWELVPRYGVGELALGGLQVGKGYLANKTKTTKSFITNANAIDGLIYLTGDMVRLNDHGFEFLGRNDDLVKITGIRIELSEISAACATVKSEEAAIEHVETLYLPLPGSDAESKSKVVVTFVSIKTSDIDTDSIRSQVIQRAKDLLPAYMVPGHVIILDGSMPRTASNKVDRKVLREIYQSSDLKLSARGVLADPSGGVDASKTEHWSEEELPIVDMITAYLEIPPERNSPDNTLAALGLSSLQITKLAWYLKRELECPINVLSLMRCQILGELINVVTDAVRPRCEATPETMIAESDNTRADHSWLANIREDLTNKLEGSMRPQDTLCVLPATPMQESLLVETMLDGGAYWTHRVFDLSHMEQIDAQRLEAAWEKCTQRFDILRSVFFPLTLFDIEGSDSSISWARAHGISSTILQFVRSNAKVYWTTCSQGDLGDHARKLQTELQPSKTDRPPWAVTYTESEHKLMLSMHHALYDGVSSQILLETVTALYRDSNHLSPDCTLQFERGLELGLLPTTEQREEAASLWAAQLMELQKAVGPTNGPFPDLTQSRQKQSREILCARAAVPAIFKSRDAAYPSVPIAFQSAFGCILAWYMELDAVILGQTVSQRIIHPDLESVMGPAIATIPVVIRASSSSASELWENMSRDSAKYSHVLRNLHPVDLKRAFKKANNGTNLPLPGIFVYHPAPHSDIEQPTSLALQMFKEQDMALSLNVEHPLALNIFEAEKTIELTGDGRQISQGQLDLMLQQTLEFMNAMVGSPDTALCQLRNRFARNLVSVSGKTLSASPQQVDPTDTVAIHASNSPDWIAAEELVFEESDALDDTILTRQITYGQLNTLTNAIATKLTTHAAQLHTDDVVAMYMARDIMSLAVTLAIFRAGFVYLPIDEDLPLARKQLIIRDAKAKLVITTADLENTLGLDRNDDPPVFLVPDGNDAIDTVSSWPRSWTREPIINGGYLLYTSGSSGRPKGVRVSAQNLCSFIEAFSTRLVEHAPATATLGNSGKYLNLTSRAFDPHLTQMFVPWYLGYRVVIGKDRNSMLASLHQVIKHSEITHFGSVPSVLTKMGLKHSDVPTVRVITTGGEQASSELLDMWSSPAGPTAADDHGRATLFNFYGPTEVTIGCLGHAVNHNSNSRNLGLPLHGLEALLICHTSEGDAVLAMRGQPGELCIAGPQVAIGYLDRPDETAKSFCTIHLPNWGEKRVYRTGDMMRMMHDGTLEFLGRIDQQTKVRGQRLELGEVVTFLKESSVGEGHLDFAAAVVSNPNANNQQVLMGFVARDARDLLRRELEADSQVVHNLPQAQQDLFNVIGQKCDEKLPAFMVPTLVWVSKIPYLAASGKVDTKQLKRLGNDFFGGQTHTYETLPTTVGTVEKHLDAKETIILEAVEEAVGSKILASATSSIAQLGVDSLSAVHLMSILRRKGFANVSMTTLLAAGCTIGSIAQSTDKDDAASPSSAGYEPLQAIARSQELEIVLSETEKESFGLKDLNIEAVLPCLPLQAALVAHSLSWLTRNPEGHDTVSQVPYLAQFHYLLPKGTIISRWRAAFERIVASEAMLRTCFVQREGRGEICQVVLAAATFSPFDNLGTMVDVVRQMNHRPPFRVQLDEHKEPGQVFVTLTIHHGLFDGAALGTLKQKLEAEYANSSSDVASSSASLELMKQVTFECQLSDMQTDSVRLQWQTLLQDVQPCYVTDSFGTMIESSTARSTLRFRHTATQLKEKFKAATSNTTSKIQLSSAFQLATALCLARLTQKADVVYGYVLSLRPLLSHTIPRVDDFIGPCLNTLTQAIHLQSKDETLTELTQRIHQYHCDASQGSMPFVPSEMVQRWVGSDRKLFDSLLSINIIDNDVAVTPENKPGGMTALHTESKSDMALAIDVDIYTDGSIDLTLSSCGVLSSSRLADTAQIFEKIVCSAATAGATVGQFVPVYHHTSNLARISDPKAEGSKSTLSDRGQLSATDSVHIALSRFLQLPKPEISTKPGTTTLYQLGLDSITVLPFVKCLSGETGLKLTVDAVIKSRTVQGLIDHVHGSEAKLGKRLTSTELEAVESVHKPSQKEDTVSDSYDNILAELAKDLFFLATPMQEGMLSASFAITKSAYLYSHSIQLSGKALEMDTPSLDAFSAAVQDVIQACEILRTQFTFTQNSQAPWLGVVSATEKSDLFNWKIVSAALGRVTFQIHHVLYDAASLSSIWRILEERYSARLYGRLNSDDDFRTYLFRPFAKMVSAAQSSSEAFWSTVVSGYTYIPLNLSANDSQASSTFSICLDESSFSALQSGCKSYNVTVKAALQLAWAAALCQLLYSQPDVIFGETISTASNLDTESQSSMLGPMINTVPIRVRLSKDGAACSLASALEQVQNTGDEIRGVNALASLRGIQTLWRSSLVDGQSVPSTLFESLFVFDGVAASQGPAERLFHLVRATSDNTTNQKARDGPVFDEYPLIANYFISGNTLCGKLRGNLGSSELEALGRAVEAMLMRIAVGDAHEPVIDLAKMKITTRHDSKKNGARSSKTDRVSELNGHTPHCDAVLDIVKAILGPRSKGRALDYYTKLANAGIDSILAIKLANAVRKKTGLIVSVFQIMKGASVRDIVENGTRDQRVEPHASTQKSQSQAKEQEMKSLVAEKLQSSEDLILSVLPVLSGQRAHLEQWLLHGKRFFEAPWLYRVLDDNIDKEMVARRWSELVRAHDILRTTFAVVGKDADLVQVTLSEADNGSSRFTVIHDDGKLIEELVTQHISKENADPSNMRKPPSRLSFLEGSDGKAVVLRFHHALYDAWSIKMIESDLINMLTHGTALQHHGSLELQVQQIRGARDLAMENSYWRQHLLRAQDTILLPAEDSQLAVQVSHGPHFKVKSSVGIPREAVDCLASTKNPSAVILFAFAKTLSRFTGRSHPTFGLSHASRVLCSTTGAQDIDLTAANMPTLTVTPMSVDLERGANAPASALTSIQHHLAQLAKFSQTGNVRKMGPRFNTHINIMFVDSDQAVQLEERPNKTKALSRWRLGEPIASDYFTISKPSTLSASLVDQLDISHLYPQQLFFNITVQDQQSISVSLSGDRSLLAGSMMSAEAFIACFTTQLEESIQQASE